MPWRRLEKIAANVSYIYAAPLAEVNDRILKNSHISGLQASQQEGSVLQFVPKQRF